MNDRAVVYTDVRGRVWKYDPVNGCWSTRHWGVSGHSGDWEWAGRSRWWGGYPDAFTAMDRAGQKEKE